MGSCRKVYKTTVLRPVLTLGCHVFGLIMNLAIFLDFEFPPLGMNKVFFYFIQDSGMDVSPNQTWFSL